MALWGNKDNLNIGAAGTVYVVVGPMTQVMVDIRLQVLELLSPILLLVM